MLPAILQRLDTETEIELFEAVGFNRLDLSEVFRFCNYVDVSYRVSPAATPHVYQAIGCESEGYDTIGQGPIPEPTVTISNAGKILSTWIKSLQKDPTKRLEGTTIIRRVTRASFLEGGADYLAVARELPPDVYQIEQMTDRTFKAVKLRLNSAMDASAATLPGRYTLRSCPFLYRGDECAYTGTQKYTRENYSTSDPLQDICNKSVTACERRFGVGSVLRFGGFPGLGGY